MDEGAELGIEEEGTGLVVAKELGLDGKLDGASDGHHHRVSEVIGEGVVDPRSDDAIHPRPIWITRDGAVLKYVRVEGELLNGERELLAPAGVVGGGNVKDDRDEAANVPDRNSLGVQGQDGGGLVEQHGVVDGGNNAALVVVIVVVVDAGWWIGRTLLGGKGQGVAEVGVGGVALLSHSSRQLFSLESKGEGGGTISLALGLLDLALHVRRLGDGYCRPSHSDGDALDKQKWNRDRNPCSDTMKANIARKIID